MIRMEPLHLRSHAKINWLLAVAATRADGFHEILSLFQALELGDDMTFRALETGECQLAGFPADIALESNLVYRAWRLMRERFPGRVHGLSVLIEKHLPRGGGLGGGSSNAAATLNAINALYGLALAPAELADLGAELGSDVPFFITSGAAIVRGRGEIVEPIASPLPCYHLVLVFPEEGMPTPEAYRKLDSMQHVSLFPHSLSPLLTEWRSGDVARMAAAAQNDFELAAADYPWYQEASHRLREAGALKTLLCGSGSTVAGLVRSAAEGEAVARKAGGILTHTVY